MIKAILGLRFAELSLHELDVAAQRAIFVLVSLLLTLLLPVYLIHHAAQGRHAMAWMLAVAIVATAASITYALLIRSYAWPLRVMLGTLTIGLVIATLNQGPHLPAAGWWLSIIPFIFAAAGLHRMAMGSVLLFLAAVTLLHAGGATFMNGLMAPDAVEDWRRFASVAGSELVALSLIIVSLRNRARVVQALEQARTAALEAGAIKARFLANMSHEIRTPLTGIIGVADVLGSGEVSESQRRQLLQLQKQSASTLLALVNDILDATKLDARQVTLESRPLDLRQVIIEANELFSMQAFAKGIELSSSCNPNVPLSVFGDAVRIRQIVNNLVGNAVKFTAKGGVHIHLSLEPVADGLPDEGAGRDKRWITIEVVDSGPGIDKAQQALLFRPFIQADETVARRYGGSGLGLSIASELSKLMGGRIDLHSAIGEGTTFTVRLPLALDSPETAIDVPRLRPDVVVAVQSRGLERHLRSLLFDLRVSPVFVDALPPAGSLNACKLLLVDAPLLQGVDTRAWISAHTHAGRRIGILTPLGVDTIAGALDDALLIYKPIRRSALEMALTGQMPTASPNFAAGPSRPLQGLRALVADDNPVNQVVVQAMLVELGVDATVVVNGLEAVECAAAERFDLVLMDVNMPRMDGLTATRVLRERERMFGRERVTVLAMTAATEGEDGPACYEAGMDGFLEKPFSLTQLQTALGRLRARHAA